MVDHLIIFKEILCARQFREKDTLGLESSLLDSKLQQRIFQGDLTFIIVCVHIHMVKPTEKYILFGMKLPTTSC